MKTGLLYTRTLLQDVSSFDAGDEAFPVDVQARTLPCCHSIMPA